MIRVSCWLLSVSLFPLMAGAQGHKLNVTIDGLANDTLFLANHYGDLQLMKDTVLLDANGSGVFQDPDALPCGIYILVFPDRTYCEFIAAEDQEFSMHTSLKNPIADMVVTGSEENQLFFDDIRFIQTKTEEYKGYQETKERLAEVAGSVDSIKLMDEAMAGINAAVETHRAAIQAKNPDLLYSYILRASENPKIPEAPVDENGQPADSNFAYKYYKAHYWDNIDFTTDCILRTSIYHSKLETYITSLTLQVPDSVIKEADYIIGKAMQSRELFKYTAAFILNHYAKPTTLCMDKVYVHVAEKYYMSGLADWVSEDQLNTIRTDAMNLKPTTCGSHGANIRAVTMDGKYASLYDVKEDFTILMFIESDCGLCQKAVEKVYPYWQSVKDKGVGAYCAAIDLLVPEWKEYITDKGYTEWINVIDPGDQSGFRDNYNVISTPIIYILDKNKNILAKRIGADQLPGYMDFLLKNHNSTN